MFVGLNVRHWLEFLLSITIRDQAAAAETRGALWKIKALMSQRNMEK